MIYAHAVTSIIMWHLSKILWAETLKQLVFTKCSTTSHETGRHVLTAKVELLVEVSPAHGQLGGVNASIAVLWKAAEVLWRIEVVVSTVQGIEIVLLGFDVRHVGGATHGL